MDSGEGVEQVHRFATRHGDPEEIEDERLNLQVHHHPPRQRGIEVERQ